MQAREGRTSKNSTCFEHVGALAVCDEHRAEVLEFINTFQGLTIKQDNLALLTSAVVTLVFEALMVIPAAAAWRLTASSRPCISLWPPRQPSRGNKCNRSGTHPTGSALQTGPEEENCCEICRKDFSISFQKMYHWTCLVELHVRQSFTYLYMRWHSTGAG